MTTLVIDRAVLEQALEALEHACDHTDAKPGYRPSIVSKALLGLRDALAQPDQAVPEPLFGDMRPAAYRFRTRGVEDAQWRLTDDQGLIRQMLELGHWEVRTLIEAPDVAGGTT
jgi:hypothetical protein